MTWSRIERSKRWGFLHRVLGQLLDSPGLHSLSCKGKAVDWMLFISLRHWHFVVWLQKARNVGFGTTGRTLVEYPVPFPPASGSRLRELQQSVQHPPFLLTVSHIWRLPGLNLDRQLGMTSKGWKWPKPELPSEGCHEGNVQNEASLAGKMKDEAKSGTWSILVRGMGALDSIQGDETKRWPLGSWNNFKWVENVLFYQEDHTFLVIHYPKCS